MHHIICNEFFWPFLGIPSRILFYITNVGRNMKMKNEDERRREKESLQQRFIIIDLFVKASSVHLVSRIKISEDTHLAQAYLDAMKKL